MRKLSEWLSADALHFEFLVIQDGDKNPLAEETKLLSLLYREQIVNGTVRVECLPEGELAKRIAHHARRSVCRGLIVGTEPAKIPADQSAIVELQVSGPQPVLHTSNQPPAEAATETAEPFDYWTQTLLRILQEWL